MIEILNGFSAAPKESFIKRRGESNIEKQKKTHLRKLIGVPYVFLFVSLGLIIAFSCVKI